MAPRVEGPHGRPTPLHETGPQTIGVDFDGTLVEHQWPDIGREMKNASRVWKRLYDAGHILVVWTARSGRVATLEAKQWFENRGLKYHGWNQLPEPIASLYGPEQSRKPHLQILIDDRNLGGLPSDWEDIYTKLVLYHGIEDTRTPEELAGLIPLVQSPASGGLS